MRADIDGDWNAVSMLGANVNWERNLLAANGHALIRHGGEWKVRLTEWTAAAPIPERYLEVAPGARPRRPVMFYLTGTQHGWW